MSDLKTVLSEAVAAAFAAEGVDPALARVTPSDRPDLAEALRPSGRTGYARQSFREKAWLMEVASGLDDRAVMYDAQLRSCRRA